MKKTYALLIVALIPLAAFAGFGPRLTTEIDASAQMTAAPLSMAQAADQDFAFTFENLQTDFNTLTDSCVWWFTDCDYTNWQVAVTGTIESATTAVISVDPAHSNTNTANAGAFPWRLEVQNASGVIIAKGYGPLTIEKNPVAAGTPALATTTNINTADYTVTGQWPASSIPFVKYTDAEAQAAGVAIGFITNGVSLDTTGLVNYYLTNDVDALFISELAAYYTSLETDALIASLTNDIASGITAYGWGDHSTNGYLTGYTETDPVAATSVWDVAQYPLAVTGTPWASAGYITLEADTNALAQLSTHAALTGAADAHGMSNTVVLAATAVQPTDPAYTNTAALAASALQTVDMSLATRVIQSDTNAWLATEGGTGWLYRVSSETTTSEWWEVSGSVTEVGSYTAPIDGTKFYYHQSTSEWTNAFGTLYLNDAAPISGSYAYGNSEVSTWPIATVLSSTQHIFESDTGSPASIFATTFYVTTNTTYTTNRYAVLLSTDILTYSNTWYVAESGDDANSGRNPDLPKVTIQAAIDAAEIVELAGGGHQNIQLSGGSWTENNIMAKGISLKGVGDSATRLLGSLTMASNTVGGSTVSDLAFVQTGTIGAQYIVPAGMDDTVDLTLARVNFIAKDMTNITANPILIQSANNIFHNIRLTAQNADTTEMADPSGSFIVVTNGADLNINFFSAYMENFNITTGDVNIIDVRNTGNVRIANSLMNITLTNSFGGHIKGVNWMGAGGEKEMATTYIDIEGADDSMGDADGCYIGAGTVRADYCQMRISGFEDSHSYHRTTNSEAKLVVNFSSDTTEYYAGGDDAFLDYIGSPQDGLFRTPLFQFGQNGQVYSKFPESPTLTGHDGTMYINFCETKNAVFGDTNVWNNITDIADGNTEYRLQDSEGLVSGITLTVTNWNEAKGDGEDKVGTGDAAWVPKIANKSEFETSSDVTGVVHVAGLVVGETNVWKIMVSAKDDSKNCTNMTYVVGTSTGSVATVDNTSVIVTLTNVATSTSASLYCIPDAGGDAFINAIWLTVPAGTGLDERYILQSSVQTNEAAAASEVEVPSIGYVNRYVASNSVQTNHTGDVTIVGTATATEFIGGGSNITYDASGNSGNLTTNDNTLQELNDAVDGLVLGGVTNASAINADFASPTNYTPASAEVDGHLKGIDAKLGDNITVTNTGGFVYIDDNTNTTVQAAYSNRGDPASSDYDINDFTFDSGYHDLDLSSIVPAGAKAVILNISIKATGATEFVRIRPNGNVNARNALDVRTQASNVNIYANGIIACDENRVVEFLGLTGSTIDQCDITVIGWIK